jgi:HEAT repeat protein
MQVPRSETEPPTIVALSQLPAEAARHILALTQGDAKARINAATQLGALEAGVLGEEGLTCVVSALLNAISDEYAAVRFSVILALGDLRDSAAVYPLVDLLNSNYHGNHVRPACAWALGNIGDVRAVPGLKAVLDDADEFVRAQTVQTLGKMKDLTSEEKLIAALVDRSDPVRSEAAEAIGLLGSTAAVPKLIECLNDSSAWVRRNAAAALAKIATRRRYRRCMRF